MIPCIRSIAWGVSRRLSLRLFWHGLFYRKIIKMTGIGNDKDKTNFYVSVLHLFGNVPSFFPKNNYDYLIAQNFLHDEFLISATPKIFFTLEPPPLMTPETRKNIQSKILKPFLYLYNEPDIKKRMFYPALPYQRKNIIRDLEQSLRKNRPKLCCIINRYSEHSELNLLQQRINFVKAMGKDIDIYGLEPWSGSNNWSSFQNYYGTAENKQETLKKYNFTLAFENSDYDGYITEKIIHAFMVGTIPLYWGGGNFLKETFPSNCYIDCRNKDPNEIYHLIKTMSQVDIISYRKAAKEFLESDAADRFTHKYLIEQIINRLKALNHR
jgi:hypothetical protein